MNNYDIETSEYVKHGLTLFQAALFGDSESEHLDKYCQILLPHGVVVDMGAGVGGMGFGIERRCLEVTHVLNVTNSVVQAVHIERAGGIAILSDYHYVEQIKDASVDFVMFNEAFGYGKAQKLFAESARMLVNNGRLVIKDFAPLHPGKSVILDAWEYVVHPVSDLIYAAEKVGLKCVLFMLPKVSRVVWDSFRKNSTNMERWHGNKKYPLEVSLMVFQKVAA
jgi:SAM-dependent methyltransferase